MGKKSLKKLVQDSRNIFCMILRLIRWDWQTLFLLELLYKLCSLVCMVPLFKMILQWTIELAGIPVLSQYTLFTLIKKPWFLVILFLLGVMVAFYAFIELTVIIHYFEAAKNKEKITVAGLLKKSWKQAIRIGQPQNICLLLFVALIIPITNLTFSSGLIGPLAVPEFISNYLTSRYLLLIPYTIGTVLVVLISFRWIFSLHEYTIHNRTFAEACDRSNRMIKGRMLRTVAVFFLWSAFLAAVGYVLYFLFLLCSALGIKAFCGKEYETDVFWRWYGLVGRWKSVLTDVLTVLGKFALISAAWYYARQKAEPELSVSREPVRTERSRRGYWLRIAGILCMIGVCVYFSDSASKWTQTTLVSAHRGAAAGMPENNLESLKKIVRDNVASSAELDIQQLADGTLVMMHDSNFKRIAGVDRYVWDVTYEEALEFDMGVYAGEEWEGTRISTLEEVLDYIRTVPWFKLILEVKSTGRSQGIEQQVLDMVKERGMMDQCIFASMNYDILKNIKKIDEKATTQLITFIAYGKLYKLEDVDIYSVEASFITRKLVNTLKSLNKPLYVWTVNRNKELRYLQSLKVDCVVTDDAYWADYMLASPNEDRLIQAVVRRLLKGQDAVLASS